MQPLDPECKRLRPLAEYTTRLPSSRSGKRLSRATLWRWALHGVRGGRLLKTVELGAGRMSCDAWVWEFLGTRIEGRTDSGNTPTLDLEERERIRRALGASSNRKTA